VRGRGQGQQRQSVPAAVTTGGDDGNGRDGSDESGDESGDSPAGEGSWEKRQSWDKHRRGGASWNFVDPPIA
jgi:hypothetical protein